MMGRSTGVVCLLPARDAAVDLPGFLESAQHYCDAIVALDDGSRDATAEVLAACPLVKILLRAAPRSSYRGWDDAANRNRLLAAAADLQPEWIIQVDADERIHPSDAAALRQFVQHEGQPDHAYGFRRFAMHRDLEHYGPRFLWVYRLFRYAAGQVFPDQRLHFTPVPSSIPSTRWLRTTLRIQHLAALDVARRRARFEKYREADPDHEFQADYANLLRDPPPNLLRWEPRPPDLPILVDAIATHPTPGPSPEVASSTPPLALTAIIIARDDAERIPRTVASVVNQDCPEPFEVIVVTSGTDATARIVREQFPGVTVVELPRPSLPGVARNAGLRLARGEYVSFPGSHVELLPGSLAARLRAHRLGYAMVTGATFNGNQTLAGWASYFVDHAANLPGQRPGVLAGAPAHCSYARAPLLEVGGFPEDRRAGEDLAANAALVWAGYVAYRDPEIRFVHTSPCRTLRGLVAHHFVRGRGVGRLLLDSAREGRVMEPYLPWRLGGMTNAVRRFGAGYRLTFLRTVPFVVAAVLATWAGAWYETIRPGGRRQVATLPNIKPESPGSSGDRGGGGESSPTR